MSIPPLFTFSQTPIRQKMTDIFAQIIHSHIFNKRNQNFIFFRTKRSFFSFLRDFYNHNPFYPESA